MIAKNNIKEVARVIRDKYGMKSENFCNGVYVGVKEGFDYFLEELWHPASEKPLLRNGKCLVIYNSGKIDIFKISFVYEMLSNYGKDGMGWKCWCYVSDLFPKQEGGEQ